MQAPGAKAEGGSGLGLAICREIIEAHGGTIHVVSAPGEGAAFTFTLTCEQPGCEMKTGLPIPHPLSRIPRRRVFCLERADERRQVPPA